MARIMSKKIREIVQTSTVLLLIVLFVAFYIIYPLITVRKMTSRPEADKFKDPEFVLKNNDSLFIENGFVPDTFDVATVDNIRLAAAYFRPDSAHFDSLRATAIIIHDIHNDRNSMLPYIQPLLDSGIGVVLYDQRACGLSGGKYHTPGIFEAEDLNQVIVNLKYHDRIIRPLIAVGFGVGADAAMLASEEEMRLDHIIAIDPNLTPNRWITKAKDDWGAFTIPLYKMVYYWWYKKLTGFPYDRYGVDGIQPLNAKTLIIMSEQNSAEDEMERLKEISGDYLTTAARPDNANSLNDLIISNIYSAAGLKK